MPSKSASQKRLMAAAAHTKGGFGGVSQAVGKTLNDADQRAAHSPKSEKEHMVRRAKHVAQTKVAAEFGKSQSTVSRSVLRDGYVSGGKA
jgi:predicted nucleic acid-binding Zn ribbon protein